MLGIPARPVWRGLPSPLDKPRGLSPSLHAWPKHFLPFLVKRPPSF